MGMQEYYGSSNGEYWHLPLAAFPPLCSSSSIMDSCLSIAAAPPDALSVIGDCSSALILREEETMGYQLPMIPAPVADDDHYSTYPLNDIPPLPPVVDGATAGYDDSLLLQPLSDIDLEAFGDLVADDDEQNANPFDAAIVPVDRHFVAQAQHTEQDAAHGVRFVPDRHDDHVSVVVAGYETSVGYAGQQQQARPVARRARRRSGGGAGSAAPAAAGRTLDHIGFEELRKFFYMPITKAAREMNVGLTVLKKRCRELGVARWPHRKMKSLKSLILNVQEMGKGMSPAAIQRELTALEMCCAMMEENPAIELTEQTKKLRQACFKENYKRRRAATVNMLDRCYDFGGHQQLPLPPTISRCIQSSSYQNPFI